VPVGDKKTVDVAVGLSVANRSVRTAKNKMATVATAPPAPTPAHRRLRGALRMPAIDSRTVCIELLSGRTIRSNKGVSEGVAADCWSIAAAIRVIVIKR